MKFLAALRQLSVAASAIALLGACQSTPIPSPAQPAETSLRTYSTPPTASVQTGGAQVIPVITAKGKFDVWTKRIGHNPKIKVLLPSSKPGLSQEHLECMESFLPQEGAELIYYDQLGCAIRTTPSTRLCGAYPATWRKSSRCARP
jgi:proline iminopeptidase